MATTQHVVLPCTLHLAIVILAVLAAALAGCNAAPQGAGPARASRDADTRAVTIEVGRGVQ